MITREEVREIVAAELEVTPETISFDEDLVRYGLHSLKLVVMAAMWRKHGFDVTPSQLVTDPTVTGWTELLATRAVAAPLPVVSTSSDDGEPFSLAPMQHAYWVGRHDGQALGGVAAHLYAEFDGTAIDPVRLERAVWRLVDRHPMLRTRFLATGMQQTMPAAPPDIWTIVDLRDAAPARIEAELERLRDEKSHQRMDVAAGRVVDFTLTLLPGDRHRLHLDMDMVIGDAVSYRRALADLAVLYRSDSADALPPIAVTFRDYVNWRGSQTPPQYEQDRQWWAERIPELPDIPALPTVAESRRADARRSVRYRAWLDAETKTRLYDLAYRHRLTPDAVFATVFAETVAQWSSEQRFLLNLPLFNRQPIHPEIDQVVGDFTNSILLTVDLREGSYGFADAAARLMRQMRVAAAHSSYEGLEVLRDLGRARRTAVTASVVYTSALHLGELFAPESLEVFGESVWVLSQGPQVNLDAQALELNGGILLNWDFRRDAFAGSAIDEMFARFRAALELLAGSADAWERPLPTRLGEQTLRTRAGDIPEVDSAPRTLHGHFFERAARDPERIALVTADGDVSYGELARRALTLAHTLRSAGVRPNDSVAVALAGRGRQVAAVLGVLAAGATYVPASPGQPLARRRRILASSGARHVITDDSESAADLIAIRLDDVADTLDAPIHTDPAALAYVLYTSGSTGEPKGVEVTHAAAANTVDAIRAEFGIDEHDRLLALSALEFDLSVFDIFAALSAGGSLVCLEPGDERDAHAWTDTIAATGVTVLNCAPGLVEMLSATADPDRIRSLRLVLTGGDTVSADLARRLRAAVPGLRFVGLGGTTETAIHSTWYEVTDATPADWATVPYGRPLAGVRCRVVNQRDDDCPDWVTGELLIGGHAVAAGYRGDPERTAQRFIDRDGVRWYRTGDLARYRPDGCIDFLGRRDHQVKIRGHRVELGEVEAALAAHPGVRHAVAAVVGEPNPRLFAAVYAETPTPPAEFVDHVAALLPAHMVPDVVVVPGSAPLTPNGKIDRTAVGAELLERSGDRREIVVPPATVLEAALEYIAAAVLEVERPGVETDFFDLGGNSVLVTTFVAKVRGLLQVDDVRMTDVFETRTIRAFADLLARRAADDRLERVARMFVEVAEIDVPTASTPGP
ncbi:amino acid adenylation domain-containing protein [Nocardia sp. NPDC055321]